jgi:hypothetical protein
MATTVTERSRHMAGQQTDHFYVWMSVACAAVAFLGFAPTYWLPMASGALKAPPVIHLHGFIFFCWTLFVVFQIWLAASGRLVRHRAVGLIGISLATAMTIFGVLAAIRMMQNATAAGALEAGKAFAIVPLGGIAFFAVTFSLAVANVSRPEWHKRLMLLATISILDAPVARWFLTFLAPPGPPGPPPVEVTILPALTAYLLIFVAVVSDWRTRGRPHGVYVIGGLALLALKFLQVPISATPIWRDIAGGILGLAGT